jgi:hypothetical protein
MTTVMEMADPRELLERVVRPARPGFYEELWDRIQAAERAAARRWRAVAVVAIAAAIGATTAAGVLAFDHTARGTIDETFSCPVPERGGVNLLNLFARIKGSPPTVVHGKRVANPATVEVDAGRTLLMNAGAPVIYQATYAGASTAYKGGYTFDRQVCKSTRPIPLSSASLHAAGTFKGTHGGGVARECWLASVATVRLRVTLGRSGLPVSARLALRSGKKLHPTAYVEWTPTLVRAWLSPSCHDYTGP